jgi:hypothetical protein
MSAIVCKCSPLALVALLPAFALAAGPVPGTTGPSSAPMNVKEKSENISATVTGTVNVGNLPSNQAVTVTNTVPVDGTVSIAGTPTVNIGTMPAVSVAATVQDPAKTAFAFTVQTATSGGYPVSGQLIFPQRIPAGHRFVAEYFAGACYVFPNAAGQAPPTLGSYPAIETLYPVLANLPLPVTQISGTGGSLFFNFSGPVKFYIDSAQGTGLASLGYDVSLNVLFQNYSGLPPGCDASLIGYLLPMP